MIKVGVVGLGAMGQHHVRLYSQLNCELVGVVDTDMERAGQIGGQYNIPCYSDYHELISKVDAVSIAVPTSLHHPVAMDFLEHGVNCLVEKPIASTLGEAEGMIESARKNGACLAIGHIERFNPAVVKLKEIVDKGILGKLLIVSTRRVGPYVPRIRDVGVVIDSATHDIGVVKYLIGKTPVSVYSKAGSLRHPNGKEDHALIVLDFSGTTACIEVNWFTPHKVRTLVATGSEGIAYLDYIEQKVTVHSTTHIDSVTVERAEPLKLEIEDFLSSIEIRKAPAVDGNDGLEILKIALESTNHVYVNRYELKAQEIASFLS